jgi:hypothetical protein
MAVGMVKGSGETAAAALEGSSLSLGTGRDELCTIPPF